jgi:hypothetical protein
MCGLRGIPLFALPHLPTAHTDTHLHPSLSFSCPYLFFLPSFMIRPHPCLLSCSLQDRRWCYGLGPVAWRPQEGRSAATSLSCGPGLQRERSWGPRPWGHRRRGLEARGVEEAKTWVVAWPGGYRELPAWGGWARRLWSGTVHCVHVIV